MKMKLMLVVLSLNLVLTACIPGLEQTITNPVESGPTRPRCAKPNEVIVFADTNLEQSILQKLRKTTPSELTC